MISLLVLIPTRNRATLAVRAATSILDQSAKCPIQVVISDNSTEPEQSDQLSVFCRGIDRASLALIRPPQPLTMTAHWEWALAAALAHYPHTHATILTDRMIFKRGTIPALLSVSAQYPASIVAYNHDRVDDFSLPVRLHSARWSNQVLRLGARELLARVARMRWHPALPRMLNCVVPLDVLRRLRDRFGGVFASISPDFNFCFRSLALVHEVIYWDRALLVHANTASSNGASVARGVSNKDNLDFLSSLENTRGIFGATPLSAALTVGNAIVHEYLTVRRELATEAFPPIDEERYLNMLALEAGEFVERPARVRAARTLREHGWSPSLRYLRDRTYRLADRAAGWYLSRSFSSTESALTFAESARVRKLAAFRKLPGEVLGVGPLP
jgi:hypothetical protein